MAVLEEKIDALLETLDRPVTSEEAADGWTLEAKSAMQKMFRDLRNKVHAGQPLPQLSISRALDHWGVGSGALLEQVAQLSNEIRSRA
jgi:hypothetical protein